MRKALTVVGMAIAAVVAGGCLQRDVVHTIYLAPGGAATWVAIEKDVYSDEREPAARAAEEEAYIAAAARGEHGVGLGLASLDPATLRTRLWRVERPYVVATEATFDNVGTLFDRLLRESRLPGYATLTRDGTRTTLAIHVAPELDGSSAEPTSAAALLSDFPHFKIVLTDGRFISATGFTIGGGGRWATPVEPEESAETAISLTLTWQARQ